MSFALRERLWCAASACFSTTPTAIDFGKFALRQLLQLPPLFLLIPSSFAHLMPNICYHVLTQCIVFFHVYDSGGECHCYSPNLFFFSPLRAFRFSHYLVAHIVSALSLDTANTSFQHSRSSHSPSSLTT